MLNQPHLRQESLDDFYTTITGAIVNNQSLKVRILLANDGSKTLLYDALSVVVQKDDSCFGKTTGHVSFLAGSNCGAQMPILLAFSEHQVGSAFC
jgi:hypothetical protein